MAPAAPPKHVSYYDPEKWANIVQRISTNCENEAEMKFEDVITVKCTKSWIHHHVSVAPCPGNEGGCTTDAIEFEADFTCNCCAKIERVQISVSVQCCGCHGVENIGKMLAIIYPPAGEAREPHEFVPSEQDIAALEKELA